MSPSAEELRLLTKVARLYYLEEQDQQAIAERLSISQATVSRLIKRARQENIVRITINGPADVYAELEQALEEKYGLRDAVVVDCDGEDDGLLRTLGAAAAFYVETTVRRGDTIGISSWSATLLAMVNAMHPLPRPMGVQVVQILGGIGNPAASEHANHLIMQLTNLVRGQACYLPAPAVVGSVEAARVLQKDQYVCEALNRFDKLSIALVGIGALEPSRLLASSGNVFSRVELDMLRRAGAVGDTCLRFFDAEGKLVSSSLDERVISIRPEQLRGVRRSVAIAGGSRKHVAIRAALMSGLVNTLITDRVTAQKLVKNGGDKR